MTTDVTLLSGICLKDRKSWKLSPTYFFLLWKVKAKQLRMQLMQRYF